MQNQALVPLPQETFAQQEAERQSIRHRKHFPFGLLLTLCMEAAIIFTGTVLPLRGLEFNTTITGTGPGDWFLLPTRLLFPGKAIALVTYPAHYVPATFAIAWLETGLLTVCVIFLFELYLLGIRFLPAYVTRRFILLSTGLFGLTYLLYPAITSQDIYSYIAYARMGVLYHLNPLTTLPTSIRSDAIYPYLFWIHQPSAYGPVWAIITCALQWFAIMLGFKSIFSTVLLLRLFGLAMHLGSTQLIWLLSGSLQRFSWRVSIRTRIAATLAFAWNPFLLFEACVNGHVDTTILFFVLLAIWFLQPRDRWKSQPYLMTAILLALATCLKVTFALLLPGLLLYLWTQRPRRILSILGAIAVYTYTVVLLYAPFWQHGMVLHVLQVNPGTTRDMNSPYEFLFHLYASFIGKYIPISSSPRGTPIEIFTHQVSMVLFIISYGALCLRAVIGPQRINSLPALVKWMALVWLLYCLVGSPWLWPWYFTTFFGLFALVEATSNPESASGSWLRLPLATRFLAFAVFILYCFGTWGPYISTVPGIPFFQWVFFRGLCLCLLPLLAIQPDSLLSLIRQVKFARLYKLDESQSRGSVAYTTPSDQSDVVYRHVPSGPKT